MILSHVRPNDGGGGKREADQADGGGGKREADQADGGGGKREAANPKRTFNNLVNDFKKAHRELYGSLSNPYPSRHL